MRKILCCQRCQSRDLLDGVQHAEASQRKTSLPVSLTFDQFELGHMPFYHAVIDPPAETCSHRLFIFLDAFGKGLQLSDAALVYQI